MSENLIISAEVQNALADKLPVVALESTIISHGMPWPQNVETAKMLEKTVRDNGGVPATIAILDGNIRVGLDDSELEMLGTSKNVRKASRRDLPSILAVKQHAATTVSATMICAHLAGIKFFATGGIGGVHRGASETFDISADLPEFTRTPVLVVCAGAKAILDIPLTMEYLETLGIPVLGYRTDEMPAFYYRSSGVKIPQRFDEPEQAAQIFYQSLQLGYKSGILVGNPVPEEFSLNRAKIEHCISEALSDAAKQNVNGQAVTPFLLGRLNAITAGDSLKTNIALVNNNAALCARIAV
ncbi:MAG: pseudouridine-5'-phosphate glycosidase, partial [Candidatus Riflebacteria bacterium]|nr:pseudouridine-5'-phosphate glycosidase [Candidatus Riflebacteria bacterium]